MKILLKGYYGFGNLGDDILMKVSYAILKKKYADASISIYSENTPNNPNFIDAENFNQYIQEFLEDTTTLVDWTDQTHYDLLFNGGGGIYKDHTYGSWQQQALNTVAKQLAPQQLRRLENRIRSAVRKSHRITFDRRVGFGLSIGPFRKSSPSYLRKVSEIGSYDALFVRDQASMDFLKSVRFSNQYYRITDIAFLTKYWLSGELQKRKQTEPSKVGVILLDWHQDGEVYFRNLKYATEQLSKQGYRVSFFSFQKSYDRHYQTYFDNQVVAWDPHKCSLKQFLSLLQNQDIIVSARAHGAIVGACLGVPSVCLGITLKLEEVSKMLRRSSILLPPPFLPNQIVQAVRQVFDQYPQYLENVQHDRKENEAQVQASETQLLEML